jgi:transposase InsO family protein
VAERVARSEQIEQSSVVDDVDRATVDNAQERDRPAVLGQDRRAGKEELDLGLSGELTQLFGREAVERRPRGEEARDLAQRRVQRWCLVLEVIV